MSSRSKIEWTDATWNPVTGCTKVSDGCRNCYAERIAKRFQGDFAVRIHPGRLDEPFRWRKPRLVFVCSMGDLFHLAVPDEFIADVFLTMATCRQHTFQVLTKRPERMLLWCTDAQRRIAILKPPGRNKDWAAVDTMKSFPWPLPNVWLGVSAENQAEADERIPFLLQTPAAVRFVSVEPMLGQVDLRPYLSRPCTQCGGSASVPCEGGGMPCPRCLRVGQFLDPDQLNWVICGGESGPGARPMYPDWASSLRDQCRVAGVPFFFKSHGSQTIISRGTRKRLPKDRLLDGRTWDQYPEVRP